MRIDSLTFFRFPAALIIVVFHFGQEATGFSGFLVAGQEMVTFFFVLSGFVLVLAYHDREGVSVRSFYLARVARIVPVYLLAVVIFIVVVPGVGANIDALIISLLFLQAWMPTYATKLNNPAWAISVEIFFYLIFPLILLSIKRVSHKPGAIIVGVLLFWLATQVVLAVLFNSDFYTGNRTRSSDFIYCFPLFHLSSFLLGVAGAYWFVNREGKGRATKGSLIVLFLAVVFLVLAINNEEAIAALISFDVPFRASFFAPFFLFLIIAVALADNWLKGFMALRPLLVLGEASYAIYILQNPLFNLHMKYISPNIGLARDKHFYIYLIFLLIVSIVVLYAIERPVGKFLRYRLPVLLRGEK